MQEFYTSVPLQEVEPQYSHSHRFYFSGSCFATHLFQYLQRRGFRASYSSFGISYNPLSIAENLSREIELRHLAPADILLRDGLYCSHYHHGEHARATVDAFIRHSTSKLEESHKRLRNLDVMVLSLGTAFLYRLKGSRKIVNNCHKKEEKDFLRYRATEEEIVSALSAVIEKLLQLSPDLKFILSVSPVRHYRDGFHQNALSKAVLHLAVESIVQSYPKTVSYFPAYEILLDELRDYRFYAPDKIHPSAEAVDYIMSKFMETYICSASRLFAAEYYKAQLFSEHIPSPMHAEEHREKVVEKFRALNCLRDHNFPPSTA